MAQASSGRLPWRDVPAYLGAQVAGAFAGVASADIMFGERVFSPSRHERSGSGQLLARAATDTFAGIRPADIPGFVGAQSAGAALAVLLFRWLLPEPVRSAEPALLSTEATAASFERT